MFLVLAGVILSVRLPQVPTIKDAMPKDPSQAGGSGWKRLLRHKAMVQLCVLGFVVFFACYGQFESGLAAFGTEAAGISPPPSVSRSRPTPVRSSSRSSSSSSWSRSAAGRG